MILLVFRPFYFIYIYTARSEGLATFTSALKDPHLGLAIAVWITTRYPTKKNISILPMFFLNYIRFLIYFLEGYSIYFNIQIF
ncbi:hypothetical protein DXA10_14810 [Firmicutes bacterium AM55-24TS]|nr:hypothetical protein DXA10_14810 [Firmicutes bacterium AM55-24TS]